MQTQREHAAMLITCVDVCVIVDAQLAGGQAELGVGLSLTEEETPLAAFKSNLINTAMSFDS